MKKRNNHAASHGRKEGKGQRRMPRKKLLKEAEAIIRDGAAKLLGQKKVSRMEAIPRFFVSMRFLDEGGRSIDGLVDLR